MALKADSMKKKEQLETKRDWTVGVDENGRGYLIRHDKKNEVKTEEKATPVVEKPKSTKKKKVKGE